MPWNIWVAVVFLLGVLGALLARLMATKPESRTRGSRFAIQPGSALAKNPPPLVMAVELVETTRLWARTVAPIEPEWLEQVAGQLLKRSYSEPHWSSNSAGVVAYEKVMLLGVPIVAGRRVAYASQLFDFIQCFCRYCRHDAVHHR